MLESELLRLPQDPAQLEGKGCGWNYDGNHGSCIYAKGQQTRGAAERCNAERCHGGRRKKQALGKRNHAAKRVEPVAGQCSGHERRPGVDGGRLHHRQRDDLNRPEQHLDRAVSD